MISKNTSPLQRCSGESIPYKTNYKAHGWNKIIIKNKFILFNAFIIYYLLIFKLLRILFDLFF